MNYKLLWFKKTVSGLLIAPISMMLLISCSTPSTPTKTKTYASVKNCKAQEKIIWAKSVIKEADVWGGLWKGTKALLNSAEKALAAGQCRVALAFADESYQKALLGLNQAYEEHTKFRIRQLEGSQSVMNVFEKNTIEKVREKLRHHQGKQAYELLKSISSGVPSDQDDSINP